MTTVETPVLSQAESIFELDARLVELMDCVEEAAEEGEVPLSLVDEINEYLAGC